MYVCTVTSMAAAEAFKAYWQETHSDDARRYGVELRLDLWDNASHSWGPFLRWCREHHLWTIATFRTQGQGGAGLTPEWEPRKRALDFGVNVVDLEAQEPQLEEKRRTVKSAGAQTLLSHHAFVSDVHAPSFEDCVAFQPDVLKWIGMGVSFDDYLQQRALYRRSSVPLIHFFMGGRFQASRWLSLHYGAPWTYVASPGDVALAPGQLGVHHLVEGASDYPAKAIFAILGDPVDHSRSPQTHLPHLQKIEPRSLFLRLNAPSETAFLAFWTLLPELRAAAVTKPAKRWAGAMGSATNPDGTPLPMNSLRRQGATFTCENTDAVALRHFLKNFGTPGDVVRVIGYGALGQTAVACALQEGFRVQVVNRSRVKAPLPEGVDFLPWSDLGGGQADLLIQASAYGMGEFPSEAEAPPALFPPFPQGARALLESVYHPTKTATLCSAEQSGLTVMDGLTFFSLQAKAQSTFFLQSLSLKEGVDE